MKIYLASSWRNPEQPELVALLRNQGHIVYDFKNPAPDAQGFAWTQIDASDPSTWTVERFREILACPVAQQAFSLDFNAMREAEGCVLALPCGRSAHMEFGWMAGALKRCVVYMPETTERCLVCGGGGQADYGDAHHGIDMQACHLCNGTGRIAAWPFEPELMYLLGGTVRYGEQFTRDMSPRERALYVTRKNHDAPVYGGGVPIVGSRAELLAWAHAWSGT